MRKAGSERERGREGAIEEGQERERESEREGGRGRGDRQTGRLGINLGISSIIYKLLFVKAENIRIKQKIK